MLKRAVRVIRGPLHNRFPVGYIVEADKDELIKNFDKFKNIKNHPGAPKAFSEKEKPQQQSLMQRDKNNTGH
jgi:hypothetical protein